MADKTYKGWKIIRPDHNSPWWDAERPSGRLAPNGQIVPESMGAGTWKALKRAIDALDATERAADELS